MGPKRIRNHPAALHWLELHRPTILCVLSIQHEFRGRDTESSPCDGIGEPMHVLLHSNVARRTNSIADDAANPSVLIITGLGEDGSDGKGDCGVE